MYRLNGVVNEAKKLNPGFLSGIYCNSATRYIRRSGQITLHECKERNDYLRIGLVPVWNGKKVTMGTLYCCLLKMESRICNSTIWKKYYHTAAFCQWAACLNDVSNGDTKRLRRVWHVRLSAETMDLIVLYKSPFPSPCFRNTIYFSISNPSFYSVSQTKWSTLRKWDTLLLSSSSLWERLPLPP